MWNVILSPNINFTFVVIITIKLPDYTLRKKNVGLQFETGFFHDLNSQGDEGVCYEGHVSVQVKKGADRF